MWFEKPLKTDDLLMIPMTKIGMGFAAGMGECKSQDDMGGSGAVFGIEPTAI